MHSKRWLAWMFVLSFPFAGRALAQEKIEIPDTKTQVNAQGVKVVTQSIVLPTQTQTYEEVTPKDKAEQARTLFHEANAKFEDRQLAEALELYEKAYALWPHPRIVFNMGVTLAMMSRPLEAANMFKIVLEYGPDPVEMHRYKEAQEKYLELMGTLSILNVQCTQAGVKVYVDGTLAAECPSQKSVTLTGGRHLVTANLEGYIPLSEDIFLPPGVVAEKIVELKKFQQGIRYKTVERYSIRWPIIAAAAAVVMMGSGGYLIYSGRQEIEDLQTEIDGIVAQQGTKPFEFDLSRQDAPVMKQNVGSGLVGVGVTSLVTATVLYFLQKKTVPVTIPMTGGDDGQKALIE